MFTGIIKEKGVVKSMSNGDLSILAPLTGKDAYVGQSIAVNGLCLTVKRFNRQELFFDFTPETYKASTLKYFKIGEKVNIEPALQSNSDISGHFVLGHIDGIGRIITKKPVGNSIIVEIKIFSTVNDDFAEYVVRKGSIAIDGISLTVNELKGGVFSVSIIPVTYNETNLSAKKVGDYVNLESDILEKTIVKRVDDILKHEPGRSLSRRFLSSSDSGNKVKHVITHKFLADNGYL